MITVARRQKYRETLFFGKLDSAVLVLLL